MKKIFRSIVLGMAIILALTAFELSGEEPHPGGATKIKVRGTIDDPAYEDGRWYTLAVGYRGRTGLATLAAWTLTKTGWNSSYKNVIPLAESMGFVSPEFLALGDEALDRSTDVAQRWSGSEEVLRLDTARLVGSSGGLMVALAKLDAQSPGDLSGGHVVAGSGVLENSSEPVQVGEVAGLPLKLQAAAWVRADLVFVPYEDDTDDESQVSKDYTLKNFMQILKASPEKRDALLARKGPLVVKVPSFATAVDVLLSLGGECSCSFEDAVRRTDSYKATMNIHPVPGE